MNRRELLQGALAVSALSLVACCPEYGEPTKGVVFWASPMTEWRWDREFRYFMDLAVAVAVGPMRHGIRRLWGEEICWYDTRPRQPDEDAMAYAERWVRTRQFAHTMVVYPGTDTQPVSPLIAPDYGRLYCASNLRGLHYVTLADYPLTPHGNRVPTFWFESA